MEADFLKSLEQLEAKKRKINEQANLTRECNSILELDQRIGLLLKEIKNLKRNVEEQSNITFSTRDKLEHSYKILQKTSELSKMNESLTKLNSLCRHLDKVQKSCPIASGSRKSSIRSNNEVNGSEIDEDTPLSVQLILGVADKFERTYQPLESILKIRQDLPYVHYAEKSRKLKDSLRANV